MDIKKQLETFYDTQAQKFSQTRQRHWPEFVYIAEIIQKLPQKKIKILELGCGDGRLLQYLQEHTNKQYDYTGVDISKKLLSIGKKNNPQSKRIHTDMLKYVQEPQQETYDIVIAIAAFQHLPNQFERLLVAKNIYRVLKFQGHYIMTNWALSKRFLKQFTRSIIQSVVKSLITGGIKNRRDMYIPRKTQGKTFHRFYHLFSLSELEYIMHNA